MTRKISVPSKAVASTSADLSVNSDNTVDLVFATQTPVLRQSFSSGPFFEVLSIDPAHIDMSRASGMPCLDSHDNTSVSSILGSVEKTWIENKEAKATVRFPRGDDTVFQLVKEKIIKNVSVGYRVFKYKDISKPNDEIPTLLAISWQPQEISLVGVPADPNSQIRTQKQETILPTEVEITSESIEMDQNKKDQILAEERTRTTEIKRAVRAAKLEESFADDLIERGLSTADASKEIFAKLEEQSSQTEVRSRSNISVGPSYKERVKDIFEDALAVRVNPNYKPQTDIRMFQGMSMVRAVEQYEGRRLSETDHQLITRAMTTSDLTNILANVAEKSMRQEFQVQTPSYRAWTKQGLLRNYKTANRLMLGDFPSLEKLNEHGEAKRGAFSESKEIIKLDRYMKQVQFTKEMIINDDLNALSDFSTKGARAAVRLESSLVYSLLASNPIMGDGNALFSTAHGNYDSTGSAINVTSIGAAWAKMKKQSTLDGLDFLDLTPKFLIVSPDKESIARQFVSQNLLASQPTNINPFAGQLTVVVDPRLSGNGWYLAADSSQIDTIEVARLEGEDGPIITVKEGQTPGSMLITCEHSAGAAVLDYRGLYFNVGA